MFILNKAKTKKLMDMMFYATFYNISDISWQSALLVKTKIGEPSENHRPDVSHLQTISHNVVSSMHRDERESNSQL